MDDRTLTAALARTRGGWEYGQAIGLDTSTLTEAGRAIVAAAGEQYERDSDQQELDLKVLESQLERRFGGEMAESILAYASELPRVSASNILDEYRLVRRSKIGLDMAAALASGKHDVAEQLIEQYQTLSTEGATLPKLRLTAEDFEDEEGIRIGLMPTTLNDYIGGGLLPGHNVTVYGRPDSGKSMFALNQAAYCLRQGKTVLYVANEEPARDITKRLLSRFLGVDIRTLGESEAMVRAINHAGDNYERWNLLHKAGCSARDIRQVAMRVQPDILIVDQLKNLVSSGAGENRALQLDSLARDVRELGITIGCATISVTQAGQTAEQKEILSMSDIEWSNTGIPGAADLLVGIGVTDEMLPQDKRILSMPKNKINGRHGSLPVWVNPYKTAFLSSPKDK